MHTYIKHVTDPKFSQSDNSIQNKSLYVYIYIQGVTGGTDQTSGECSLGHTIPI